MRHWRVQGLILLLLIVSAAGIVLGQESTEEAPNDQAVEEPSGAAALPGAAEITVEPSTEITEAPPLPTEPVVEASPEATLEVTEAAAPTAEATDAVLPTAEVTEAVAPTAEATDLTQPELTPEATAEITETPTVDPDLLIQPTVIFADPEDLGFEAATTRASTIAAPALTAPADAALSGEERPTFRWNAVSGADRYQLQVATTEDFADGTVVIDIETTSRTFRPGVPQALVEGDYFWRVRSRERAAGEWGEYDDDPRELRVHMLGSPLNNAFVTDTTPTFSWNKHDRAVNYRILLATDDAFTSLLPGFPFDTTATRVTLANTAALPFGVYFWRVDLDYGSGFVVSPFFNTLTITPAPPRAPNLLEPASRSLFDNDPLPVFKWTATTSTEGAPFLYQIQFSTDSRFRVAPVIDETIAALEFTPTLPDGRWFWRARALNVLSAPGAWSRTFEVNIDTTSPEIPDLLELPNGGVTTDTTPRLRWEKIADAVQYQVRLNTGITPIILVTTTNRTDYTPATPLLFALYSWQVQAVDAAGNESGWSGVFSFNVESPTNASPLLNRAPGAQAELSWTPISWAAQYEVEVANNRSFAANTIVFEAFFDPNEFSTLTAALPDGIYYWRARAQRSDGRWGSWSTIGTFSIED